ncbi:ribosome maturation factor RimM [Micromonospora globispora]|uniref:Ribosome maturation factor RimM n=1 Tax=Micromonospora globispora TaxID=1450148 RepID=A0A317K9K1_9ACTN|nr:ribosome maturation factor RimM [Micromonospora globispora]PWU49779.1 ribosome maturation factor RimM [Micromonospora globispora]PWU54690.1 ribosome maturation factor RimM [Micromonospora globispora]RQW82040.1 ribosome maturation factor RimM [Micromonospora globispora]
MLLIVGRIGKPHGIRGEVTVEVRTDEPEARFAPGMVLRTTPGAMPQAESEARVLRTEPGAVAPPEPGGYRVPEELTVESARWHQGGLLVVFDGVLDRNVAEALRGTLLGVDSAAVAPPEDPEEFHDHQLVGLAAVNPAGERLGEVDRIDHAPASDLLVLRRPDGRTALIPFVKAIVPEVDLAGGRVVVDPPGGLLDL